MANYAAAVKLLLLTFLLGCQGDKESRNAAEIVQRSDDTTFNAVPGNDMEGSAHGDEAYAMVSDDIVEVLKLNGMEAASEAVQAAGLTNSLKEKAAITFFAPSDVAFNRFRNSQKLNKEALKDLLLSHAVVGIIKTEDLVNGRQLTTLSGKRLTINIQENKLRINNATIVDTNLAMDNGIIYKISEVIRAN